jgi:hypothetical protein
MLDRAKRPSWSEQSQAAVRTPAPEPLSAEAPKPAPGQSASESVDPGARRALFQPRVVAALTLIVAGVVWAAIRGLEFSGLSPVNIVYDLDQPPLLLVAVAAWLLFRSRPR